ncbi:hypothetical protein Bca52824_002701 [Brassica carinata]|uniref:Peptidase A1 domain-containing protein n=1 Tax=Brassica carinata TaxID=52824 RepID=A0A8X7WL71_BRACI|nr:hypothetical protein Bca52824_002701 [Brassica carinata]
MEDFLELEEWLEAMDQNSEKKLDDNQHTSRGNIPRMISRRQAEFDRIRTEREEHISQMIRARKQERDIKRKQLREEVLKETDAPPACPAEHTVAPAAAAAPPAVAPAPASGKYVPRFKRQTAEVSGPAAPTPAPSAGESDRWGNHGPPPTDDHWGSNRGGPSQRPDRWVPGSRGIAHLRSLLSSAHGVVADEIIPGFSLSVGDLMVTVLMVIVISVTDAFHLQFQNLSLVLRAGLCGGVCLELRLVNGTPISLGTPLPTVIVASKTGQSFPWIGSRSMQVWLFLPIHPSLNVACN